MIGRAPIIAGWAVLMLHISLLPPDSAHVPILKSTIDKVLDSGVFDRVHYCAQIGKQLSFSDAVADYVGRGEAAGLSPNVLFCPAYVRRQLSQVSLALDTDSILMSYLNNPGAAINPHPLFDCQYYRVLTGNASLDKTCLEDYISRTQLGGFIITPHILFDCQYYCKRYPDVAARKVDPLRHYLRYGWIEGRQPHPLFMAAFWRADLVKQGIDPPEECPLTVYVSDARTWRASPHPLFDVTYYQAQLAKKGLSPDPDRPPLIDLLLRADRIPCHPLFDCEFYELQATSQNMSLAKHPLLHYVRRNGRSGIDPHPLFCSSFYIETNPDVVKGNLEPLQHFIERGRDEQRDPCPLFSQRYYSANISEIEGVSTNLLDHYIRKGGQQLLDPHPLFESKLYAAFHPECLDNGDNPLAHYVRSWARRGIRFPPWGTLLQPRRNSTPESAPIDVILVSHELTRTGAPAILLKLVEHLVARKGLQTLLLSAQSGALLDDFCEWTRVIDLAALRSGKIPIESFLNMLMMSFTAGTTPRIVIMNTACISSLTKLFHSRGFPVVTLVHEIASIIDFQDFKDIYDCSQLVVYPAVVVRNEAHSHYLLPACKTEVIPQGLLDPDFGRIDKGDARASLLREIGAPPTAFIVLGCGNMDLRKGIDVFVKVAAAAIMAQASKPERPPLHFVWVGGGPMHRHTPYWYAQEDVKRSHIGGNVHFLGPRSDTEPYFAGCDAFLLTSRLDPFPCVVHEAMACGKPVIAFDNSGGAPEAISDGAGVVVPYGDIAAVVSALHGLADDPVSAAAYGRRAEEVVRQKYSFNDYVDKLLVHIAERTGVELARKEISHRPNATRDRVIFTLPAWEASSVNRFIEQLVCGLSARGVDAELLFTQSQPSWAQLKHMPKAPYRFLTRGFRKQLPFHELWDRLERTLEVAAPAVFIHGNDHIASAVAPVVPRKVGVLGILHEDDQEYYEQAARLGRFWQRAIAVSPRIVGRVAEIAPSLTNRVIYIPHASLRYAPPAASDPLLPLRILIIGQRTKHPDSMPFLTPLLNRIWAQGTNAVVTVIDAGAEAELLKLVCADELAAGRLVIEDSPRSERIAAIMQNIDIALSLPAWFNGPVSILEAISFGIATLPPVAEPADCAHDLDAGHIGDGPAADPESYADRLIQLAADRPQLDALRRTAYETALARSLDIDTVCDQYATLIGEMLHELRTGTYSTPTPVFIHPAFGGRSLPPALQFDPDQLAAEHSHRGTG